MANLITREQDGTWTAGGPFLVTCGCGGVTPDAKRILAAAGASNIPFILSTSNHSVKGYLRQQGLMDLIPSLNKSKHAVLYNPLNGRYVNLFKAPRNAATIENVRRAIYG